MATPAGWFEDPSGAHASRYWDGSTWTEHVADGGVVTTAPLTSSAPPLKAAEDRATTATLVSFRPAMSATSWFIFGGSALAALGTLLPWEQDTTPFGQITNGPSKMPAAVVMLLLIVAGAVWAGWPSRLGRLSKGRCIGLASSASIMALFLFAKLSKLAQGNAQAAQTNAATSSVFGTQVNVGMSYHPGLGLYLWGLGTVCIVIGTVKALRGRKTTGTARP
jgi:hypothetical protein